MKYVIYISYNKLGECGWIDKEGDLEDLRTNAMTFDGLREALDYLCECTTLCSDDPDLAPTIQIEIL